MSVKIEMDMPTTCATCKLSQFIYKGDNSKWYCTIKEKHSRLFPTKRPTWCPLKECEKMSVDNRASMTEVWETVKYLHPRTVEILTTKFSLQARQEFLFDVIDAYKRAYPRPMLKIKREENKK